MKAFYSDVFVLPLSESHRFPMRKYSRLRERIIDMSGGYASDIEPIVTIHANTIQEAAADAAREVARVDLVSGPGVSRTHDHD